MTGHTALAAMAAGALSLAGCSVPAPTPPRPIAVREAVVEATGAPGSQRYSAAILPARRVDLAFRLPGYVVAIEQVRDGDGRLRPLQEGDRVQLGQVLARIRPDDFDARMRQASSQQVEAAAALNQARLAFERASGLYERKSLTRPEYEAAKAAHDAMAAKEAGARALVDEAQSAQSDASLRSPLKGIVLARLIEVGSLVGPGTPGFVIADLSSVKIPFGVPDAVVRRLAAQQPVTLTTAAYPNERFRGRITALAPAAAPGSLVFDVEVTVSNPDRRLKPGMVAALEIDGEAGPSSLTVPLPSIVRSKADQHGFALFVIEERDGTPYARMREVTLGDLAPGGVTVTGGLRQGERIIVSGATIVGDGDAVELVR